MSVNIEVSVGYMVPLNLKYNCPNGTTYYAQAKIKDKIGNLLTTISMTDIGDGQYVDNSFQMPNIDFLYASYKLFLDAGFTNPADIEEGHDVFSAEDGEVFCPDEIKISIDDETVNLAIKDQGAVLFDDESQPVELEVLEINVELKTIDERVSLDTSDLIVKIEVECEH